MATFPERALAALLAAVTAVSDRVLAPLLALPSAAGLLVVAVATAVVVLLVARRVSDQRRIAAVKRQIAASLLEIRLFNADPVAVLRAAGAALRHNARYVALSLVPVAWLAVPLGLLVAQLQAVYGYDGVRPGEPVLLRVHLGTALPPGVSIALEAPSGVDVQAGPVRLAPGDEIWWRLVPRETGPLTLGVRLGDAVATKTLMVGQGPARRSPVRPGPGLWQQLQWPSEPPLDAGPMTAIAVRYPDATIDVAGWPMSWLVLYGVSTLAAAWLLAPRFGVTL